MSNDVSKEASSPLMTALVAWFRWAMLAGVVAAAAWSWSRYVWDAREASTPASRTAAYQCPMHPEVVSHEPGVCPICHMALEPVSHSHGAPSINADAAMPDGVGPISISKERAAAIGIRTVVVREESVGRRVRAPASIGVAESGTAQVHVRTPGFVERVDVSEPGATVAKGQSLLAFYAPEILQAQEEFLVAHVWGADGGARLAEAGRTKLELLGMPPTEVDAVLASGKAHRVMTVVAPRGGVVTKKNVVSGSYVTPEMVLYEIQDLRHLFVVAEVPVSEARAIKRGSHGVFQPNGGGPVPVVVDLVYPSVNADSRTIRVRMPLGNEGLAYAPGQFGEVEWDGAPSRALVVPRDSVVYTGKEIYVYIEESGGAFSPRAVRVQNEFVTTVAVEGDLRPGDRVVVSATFLLDSESRMAVDRAAPKVDESTRTEREHEYDGAAP